MKLNLSHSSISTYTSCGYKYKLEKIDKISTDYYKSSFFFGTAIDGAVEEYMESRDFPKALVTFYVSMAEFKLNGESYSTENNLDKVHFSAADLQPELLTESMIENVWSELEIEPMDVKEFIAYYKENKGDVPAQEKLVYNALAFKSLCEKGSLLMQEFCDWIDENVDEVHSTQRYIEIENEEGDKLRGYLDAIVTLNSGKKVVLDIKTSSNAAKYYPEGVVEESQQLTIYSTETEVYDAAFLAGCKNIRKREPRVRLTYREGVITEEQTNEVFEHIDEVLHDIRAEKFEKNKDSCFQYGKCSFYNLCHHGSMKGLVKLDDK